MGVMHPIADSRAARLAGLLLNKHSRQEIADAVEIMVDVLDLMDGDPEAEEVDLEDSFVLTPNAAGYDTGAGCPVSDSTGDQAWIEWQTMRGSQKRGHNLLAGQEDDEDDDPAEEDDDSGESASEDEPSGAPFAGIPYNNAGPGCPIADPASSEDDDPGVTPDWLLDQEEMAPKSEQLASMRADMLHHRDRIRRTRCNKVSGPWAGFRLKAHNDPT